MRDLKNIRWEDYHQPGSLPLRPVQAISGLIWPNQITQPIRLADREVVAAAEGFFSIPFTKVSQAGTITLLSVDQLFKPSLKPLKHQISPVEASWFYHQAEWVDLDGDGNLDVLSARSNWNPIATLFDNAVEKVYGKLSWLPFIKGINPPNLVKGEMLWFKNPGPAKAFTTHWEKHTLLSDATAQRVAPDLFFSFCQIGEKNVLIAPSAWKGKFAYYWRENETDAWTSKLKQRILPDDFGSILYDVQCVDLNGDGTNDILFSNHEAKAADSAVFALEFVDEDAQGRIITHQLQTQIATTKPRQGQASPGQARAYHSTAKANKKPYIVVSGDGAEQVYLLRPSSPDKNNWSYTSSVILDSRPGSERANGGDKADTGSVTGGIDIGLVDETPNNVAFVPLYHWNEVRILSLP